MESVCSRTGMIHGITSITPPSILSKNVGAEHVRTPPTNSSKVGKSSSIYTRFSFKIPFQYLWQGGGDQNQNKKNALLLERGISVNPGDGDDHDERSGCGTVDDDDENCDVCRIDDDEEEKNGEIKFDRYSFSRLLKKVSMAEAKLYAKLSYLGSLTYSISKIQPENLLRYYHLQFVTSSLEKKEPLAKAGKGQARDVEDKVQEEVKLTVAIEEEEKQKNFGDQISDTAAYQVAASTASYLYSQTKSILPFNSSGEGKNDDLSNDIVSCSKVNVDLLNSEMASFMATTTDSLTAVVGAKEDVKQAVADDLNSVFSSPCEWFICDDDLTETRFFVIQGSESLASWQANLLFEPVQFEGHDVLVHRGIYEAARGIYEQMLPQVRAHLISHGDRATLRFTGHSLGGSLALLLNLMFLVRGEVPISSLLPVIAYGAPYVMCGGDHLLRQLGLPKNHFQAIAMHRDIVPRAFSSLLSSHLIELIKAMNGKFRSHPCLNNQKFLFAPMGELLILQPDDKFSPHHHLLPPGNGLYLLTSPVSSADDTDINLIPTATKVFLNSPHPLEILSDRAAYGSEGTIIRDHDMSSYLKSIRSVIRQDLTRIRRAKKAYRRKIMQPLVISDGNNNSYHVVVGQAKGPGSNMGGQRLFSFSGIIQTGRDSFKRFSRLFASNHMHLLVVLFPARLLILETFSISHH